jgi:hypothetical protein
MRLDRSRIEAYLAAVEEEDAAFRGDAALVPPLAILAFSMRGLSELLAARPGTVHLMQRLSMRRAVPVDAEVAAALVVQSRSVRKGFAALNLSLEVTAVDLTRPGERGDVLLDGAMLLMVPLAPRGTSDV